MSRKKMLARYLSVLAVGVLLSVNALAQAEPAPRVAGHAPITEQLITMVEHNAELKGLLTRSIEQAKKVNPDPVTNPAQTLEGYYAFIDWAVQAMPWSILPNLPYSKLYDQIDQSLDYFYFINDQPLAALKDKGYYHNSLQYHEPYRSWMIRFTKEWGLYLSQEGSWKEEYYQQALADERFGLQKGWYEAPSRWKSFNDFFARYLSSPAQRPIVAPGDPAVVAAPADSKPQGVWRIDKHSQILNPGGVAIKSQRFRSVAVLIGEGSAYREAFAGGKLTLKK
jgi:phosphatidylserine decarboxylase